MMIFVIANTKKAGIAIIIVGVTKGLTARII